MDDEEVLAKIGKKILEKLGHEVIIFTYSIDALKVFCQTPYKFDMVITDYNMPHMNGGQLAIKIKGVIIKPYQMKEMIGLVQHLLTSNDAEDL